MQLLNCGCYISIYETTHDHEKLRETNDNPLTLHTGSAVLILPCNSFDETCPHELNERAVSKHCSLTDFISKFGALSGESVPRAGPWQQTENPAQGSHSRYFQGSELALEGQQWDPV